MPEIAISDWDHFLLQYPQAHLLQTSAWGELKSHFGWSAIRLVEAIPAGEAAAGKTVPVGAQVLFRRMSISRSFPFGVTIAYLPKGPVGSSDWTTWQGLWGEVDTACRKRGCIFLKVEPDLWETSAAPDGRPAHSTDVIPVGFQRSSQDIQPPRTLLVDLHGSEDDLLGRMKQKTRYNIRLALKRGVVIAPRADMETFHRLMQATGLRDAFGVHSLDYYRQAYELFYPHGDCELFFAEYEERAIAALMVFAHGERAWYFYGASVEEHREKMPTYLLQWEAMRWARSRGCISYDLWGVPDADEDVLESGFSQRNGGLWGVYRFKRGFGGQLFRAPGPWDRVYRPALYQFYRLWQLIRSHE